MFWCCSHRVASKLAVVLVAHFRKVICAASRRASRRKSSLRTVLDEVTLGRVDGWWLMGDGLMIVDSLLIDGWLIDEVSKCMMFFQFCSEKAPTFCMFARSMLVNAPDFLSRNHPLPYFFPHRMKLFHNRHISVNIPSLKLTYPLKIGRAPRGKYSSNHHFQVLC